MSADIHIGEYDFNVTYNLSAMLEATGVWPISDEPQSWMTHIGMNKGIDGWRVFSNVRAADLAELILAVLTKLKTDPEKYRTYNPPNGWGSYDDLVSTFEGMLKAIEEYPDEIVRASL